VSAATAPPDLVFETPRLWLRRTRVEDVDAMFAVFGDPLTMKYFPAPWTRAQVVAGIERRLQRYVEDGFALWTLVRKDTSDAIGDCGLMRQDLAEGPEVEVGYHLRRDQLGHGYATEAARACMEYGFENLGLQHLISLILPAHVPSQRVAERNGMKVARETMWKDFAASGVSHYARGVAVRKLGVRETRRQCIAAF
jgi:ribosomal-protein-alanine N-acetyltransferase